MEAESYGDERIASFIQDEFVPLSIHVKEHPAGFKRFDAIWTPSVLVLDANGHERHRIEGYLPPREFHAQLILGLARVAAVQKNWTEAERRYQQLIDEFSDTRVVAEAVYWRGVSRYNRSHDAADLGAVATELDARFTDTIWAMKSQVWRAA